MRSFLVENGHRGGAYPAELRKKSPITSKFSYSRYAILRRRPAWHAGLHDLAVGGAPLPAALRRREEVRREEEHIP